MIGGAYFYDAAMLDFPRGELDWETAPVRVMLVTGDYMPSQTEHETAADVRGAEVKPAGSYVRGGAPLPGRQVARSADNTTTLQAGSVRWDNFTGQFRYAVVYRSDTDALICYSDLGRQETTNGTVEVSYRDGFGSFSRETDL